MLSHKNLMCLGTKTELIDDGFILSNKSCDKPALLRTVYFNKKLKVRGEMPGIYRFMDWLPISRTLDGSGCPVTFKSNGLGGYLRLSRLYITFNGYWPEKGANMTTGTFKECEAYSVCARLPKDCGKVLVVASAGNTARAFIKVCSENDIPLAVIVPEKCLHNLWYAGEKSSCVKVIAVGGEADYYDAIHLSNMISELDGFQNEGGAKNVARRDGMGTTVLSAVSAIGEIPDYYFQAIGSGTGAIAAYEGNLRFIESGMYGNKKMSLQLSQNEPFNPIYTAWKSGSPTIEDMGEEAALARIEKINAKVLSNRKPPYSITGGLFEALRDSGGDVITATNEEAADAQRLFEEHEGSDICPEAGIALASLIKKVKSNEIDKDAVIMLNITGGGIERLKKEFDICRITPDIVIDKREFESKNIEEKVSNLFTRC